MNQFLLAANAAIQSNLILEVALLLSAGYLMSRLSKKLHLPYVTGYLLAGILIGPSVLQLISSETVARFDVITDIALAFIAFQAGRFFNLKILRSNGRQMVIITIMEALGAAIIVTLVMYFIFHLSLPFSLLLGAIGCATAPASTIMTIRQYKAKGNFVNMILQVTALDDAVALLTFSACMAVVQAMDTGVFSASVVIEPVLLNLAAVGLGIVGGYVLKRIITEERSDDSTLILSVIVILTLSGICTAINVSPLLCCMCLGASYINFSKNQRLFDQLNNFTPPILTLFFVCSGMRLNLSSLKDAGIIGVAYFFIRIVGKYIGSYLGGKLTQAEPSITNYLGLALIPQAGVSIGLAALGQRLLPPQYGTLLTTIILSSSVLYEMVGPACAKLSLHLSHSIPGSEKEADMHKNIVLPKSVPHKS